MIWYDTLFFFTMWQCTVFHEREPGPAGDCPKARGALHATWGGVSWSLRLLGSRLLVHRAIQFPLPTLAMRTMHPTPSLDSTFHRSSRLVTSTTWRRGRRAPGTSRVRGKPCNPGNRSSPRCRVRCDMAWDICTARQPPKRVVSRVGVL